MDVRWTNGALWIGKDYQRGPPYYEFWLGWNSVELIEQRKPTEGESRFLDSISFHWKWPRGWNQEHWFTKSFCRDTDESQKETAMRKMSTAPRDGTLIEVLGRKAGSWSAILTASGCASPK